MSASSEKVCSVCNIKSSQFKNINGIKTSDRLCHIGSGIEFELTESEKARQKTRPKSSLKLVEKKEKWKKKAGECKQKFYDCSICKSAFPRKEQLIEHKGTTYYVIKSESIIQISAQKEPRIQRHNYIIG